MKRLIRRASTRWVALSLAAAVAGAPALPASAIAASPPDPSPGKGAAAVSAFSGPFTDLGSLNTIQGQVGGINNKGQVASAINRTSDPMEAKNGAVLFSGGSFTDIHASLGDVVYSRARDVNDDGTVVGTYGTHSQSYIFKDGAVTRIDLPLATALNNKGQVVGPAWIRDPDGSVLRLQSWQNQRIEVSSLNNSGSVAGGADMNPDPKVMDFRAFRTKPGEPVNPIRDRLEYIGSTVAFDINDKGQVAGYGTDRNDGYVPLIWDANGTPKEQRTSHGGMVDAINNAGIGVGRMYGIDRRFAAAIYFDGYGTDLNTFVMNMTNLDLIAATGINDANQIAGIAKDADNVAHAFLLDLGAPFPEIMQTEIQSAVYPDDNNYSKLHGVAVDGNPMRIVVALRNASPHPVTVQLQAYHSPNPGHDDLGTPILDKPEEVYIRPLSSADGYLRWSPKKTSGIAWDKGEPVSRRYVKLQLLVGGVEKFYLEKHLDVMPKPTVLVHGWKSDAQAAWGNTGEILKKIHPRMGVFAVGDGQFGTGPSGGTLDTGTESEPFKRTKMLWENAEEMAMYVENVRRRTGAFQVDVIAHSMGGLITRQYVQTKMPKSSIRLPAVNRMLQMGTPNMGSCLADMLVEAANLGGTPVPYFPATYELTTDYMDGVFNRKYLDLKDVRPSNLVGVGRAVPCGLTPPDGDGIVPVFSSRFIYTDTPRTGTAHTSMTSSEPDFLAYIRPRLAVAPDTTGTAGPAVPGLRKDATVESDTETAVGAAAEAEAMSTFATSSTTVEPGRTASVPLDVPQGTAFGVTGVLPPTVGLLLRDPSGKPAAQYAAGSEQARQPVQGLSVAKPRAGAWKLEITNSAAEPVTATLGAWVAGNPVKVSAVKAGQSSDEGRVRVVAGVTDGGAPVTGVPVKAILLGTDGTRHEVVLQDDGDNDDGAAGDGVYGAVSEPLADGAYGITVRADIAKGLRTARAVVEVRKPDLREFELTLSAQPGGSVTASPARDTYRAGTEVTITATAEAGRMPLGWTVDGEERPAGTLKIVMDGPHTVVARFGSYTVTELGGLPGGEATSTSAVALNDRGQVAATTVKDGKRRAVRWETGALTDLGGLPCTAGPSSHDQCHVEATGINEAGDVSGYAVTSVGDSNVQHPVLFGRDGSVADLDQSSGYVGAALDVNDNGQVFGVKDVSREGGKWVMWDQGPAVELPATLPFHAYYGYSSGSQTSAAAPRINARGAVVGARVNETDFFGTPVGWAPAVYQDGVTGELPRLTVPGRTCDTPYGAAYDINTTGVVAGSWACSRVNSDQHAVVWQDGQATDLGVGVASAVNDSGLVAGSALDPDVSTSFRKVFEPVLWLEGVKFPLAGLLPRPLCPQEEDDTTVPCMGLRWLYDVNAAGQIVAQGFVRDRSPSTEGFVESRRSFLLTPTVARTDLEVTAEVSAGEPGPASKVTWTATVTNKGDDTATDVRLDVLVPQAVTGATCDTWRGVCSAIKGGFRNTVKVLEPGWSATVEVTATVPAGTADGTELKTRVMAASLAVSDPKITNNGAEVTSTVRPLLNRSGVNWLEPVEVGQVSHEVAVTLTNRLNGPIPLKVIAVSGPFTQSNACPVELAVGQACTVQVRFAPTAEGPAGGTLTFTTADDVQPAFTVPLTGQGAKAGSTPVVQAPAEPVRGQVGRPFTLQVPFTDSEAGDTHTAQVAWGDGPPVPAEVTPQSGGGTVTVTRTFTTPRTGIALVMVTDGSGRTGSAGVPYVIEEATPNQSPRVLDGASDVELTVGETLRRTVTFTDPDSTSWTATVDYGDGSGPQPVTPDAAKQITLERQWATPGTYPVTVKVTDDGGLETAATFTVTVVPAETPNQAPVVSLTGPDTIEEGSLWKAEGAFTDDDSTSWTATVDYGDGNGPRELNPQGRQLTLEHTPGDDGERTVTVAVTDDKGATGTVTLKLRAANAAPRVRLEAPAVAKVVPVGQAISLSASFTDPGSADTHTATWTVGGQPVTGAVAENGGTGTVSGSHVFTRAGRYPISVTVTDDDGGAATAGSIDGKQAYVLVYDPAGSLIGAGQTVSPAGACTLNAECARQDKATFHITARYRHKATTPTGGLHYDAPGFDLRDTSYTVLAANGGTAVLHGEGKVNKTVDVVYEITAVDSGKPADRTDKLVVRVWKKNGELVYDNSASPSPVTGVIRVSG
ncbi:MULTISPECIES: PKD domain-containing protein [Streptosporangium]|uniref:Membrane protein/pimeloyl-ACP methyl ester carboxylesterase n=1 Tax=Streptosporangium brasiliense TaxID=47480 RepID=A0ABT9REY0_9ACTN|nr:PKD domain-containing protein [Streptosporangium brasiliense]MDP9867826.1 putative membrane protein/pimeloyl-ACP methyl ester carboxylesterase [Streptosporangium brasiliense]